MSSWGVFCPLYSVPHFEGRQCPFIDLLGGKGEFFLVDPYTKDVALLGYQLYMYVYTGWFLPDSPPWQICGCVSSSQILAGY